MLLARTGDDMEISGRLLFRLVKARARSITIGSISAFDAEGKGGVQRQIINVLEDKETVSFLFPCMVDLLNLRRKLKLLIPAASRYV